MVRENMEVEDAERLDEGALYARERRELHDGVTREKRQDVTITWIYSRDN